MPMLPKIEKAGCYEAPPPPPTNGAIIICELLHELIEVRMIRRYYRLLNGGLCAYSLTKRSLLSRSMKK